MVFLSSSLVCTVIWAMVCNQIKNILPLPPSMYESKQARPLLQTQGIITAVLHAVVLHARQETEDEPLRTRQP